MAENPIRYQDLISPDDSIEKLIGELEQLQKVYTGMAESVRTQAQGVAQSLRTVSGATADGRKAISEQSEEAKRLEKAYKQLDAALAGNAKEIAKLNIVRREANNYNKLMVLRGKEEINTMDKIRNASYQQLSAQYSLNKAYINTLTLKEREKKENRELIRQSEQIYEQMKKLQAETGKHQLNVGNYPQLDGIMKMLGSRVGITGDLMGALTSETALMTAAISASTAAVVAGTKAWADYNAQLSQQTQVASVVTNLTGQDLQDMVTAARSLARVYDTDYREVITAANTLMMQFGASGSEAMDILRDGMQGMLQGDGQKLLQMIQQYAPAFRDAGISARQLVAIIHNSEGGIFSPENMNAIVMGIKNIRLMTNSTRDALAKIGVDGEEITRRLNDGTMTIFDALRLVSTALEQVDGGSQAAGEVMQQVFGRQGTAAGTKLAEAIATLNTNLDETKTQTGDVGEALARLNEETEKLERQLADIFGMTGWEEMGIKIKTEVIETLSFTLEVLENIYGMIDRIGEATGFTEFLATVLKVIGPLSNVYSLLREIKNLAGGGSGGDGSQDGAGQKAEEAARKATEEAQKRYKEMMARRFKNYDPTSGGGVGQDRNGKWFQVQNGKAVDLIENAPAGGGKSSGKSGGGGKSTANTLREQQKAEQESISLRRKYEDTMLELIDDEFQRERAKTVLHYDRQKEDLQRKLDEDIEQHKLSAEDRQVIAEQIEALEKAKQVKLADIWEKELRKEQEANEKKRKAEEQARQATLRDGEKAIEVQYDIQQEEIEQLETSEKEKTRLRLEAEKERLQKLLELYEKNGKKLSDEEVALIRKQIEGVDKELERNRKKNKDIYDVMGFTLTEDKKEAINTALSYSLDALNSWMDSLTEAADRKRQLADDEVDRAQSVLQAEIEARANGYANEVDTARKEVEEAKKQQQKAIENQQKMQKAKLALDTITQASNLITASSLIWSQLGFPWAIPALAVMWGSFAAAKIKALDATRNSEQYGEGTVELLEGGSHQSGNDIDLGRKSDGTRRRAEGGEFFAVINKRNSRRYRSVIPDVINSLNDGTFAEKYQQAYAGGDIQVYEDRRIDISRLSDDVHSIREQGERGRYTDGRGNTVLVYKNLKRTIRS